jgi:hypothetical protein
VAFQKSGKPEIEQLLDRHHNVRGLDVAVENTPKMSVLECVLNLDGVIDQTMPGQRSYGEMFLQRPAFHVFRGQVTRVFDFADFVQDGNPGMIQRRYRNAPYARSALPSPHLGRIPLAVL